MKKYILLKVRLRLDKHIFLLCYENGLIRPCLRNHLRYKREHSLFRGYKTKLQPCYIGKKPY